VQALGKGDKPERVVRDATALAATRIVFVESARSVVRASAWSDDKRRRFHAIAVEAARQSGRGDVPVIEGPVPLAEAVSQVNDAIRLCLAPGLGRSLRDALQGREADSIALFVGPEGGFDDGEISSLADAGIGFVVLGELVLRTEVAAAAALAAVVALRG
jgi:16S rRNA (uracil1498-N3)-methyltransferase